LADQARHPLLDRLHERRARHARRSLAYRIAFAAAGFAVVGGGIVLSLPLVPGPGFLLIAIGLGMLALEFDWAERLVERVVTRLEPAASLISPRTLLVAAAVILAGSIAVALLFDVPYLPV
jgi:uncharacterized protein (TIGR02611 family)